VELQDAPSEAGNGVFVEHKLDTALLGVVDDPVA
jgi:hypothetical protein